jgi:hypothetical protein
MDSTQTAIPPVARKTAIITINRHGPLAVNLMVNENNLVYKTLQKSINEAGFQFTLEQVLAEGATRRNFRP